jgi:pteridine reductase
MTHASKRPVAVVTAGSKRLGAASVLTLAQNGFDVVVHYHSAQAEALTTTRQATAAGARAISLPGDLTQRADVEDLLQRTVEHFGHVDLLVTNAGAFRRTPLATLSDDEWNDMIDHNLRLTWLCAQSFGLHMQAQGGGSIITMADVAALRPWKEYLPYNVAKARITPLPQPPARDRAPTVRVTSTAPGPVLSPDNSPAEGRDKEIQKTLLKRAGTADHIAQAVLFLARNDYITGIVLPVDGGRQHA